MGKAAIVQEMILNESWTISRLIFANSRHQHKRSPFGPFYQPGLRILLIHPLLALLEQADGLLGLLGQVLHEDPEVLVVSQRLHLALVASQDGAQVLVGVWQQVEDVRGAVLQSQFGVLAQPHHLQMEEDVRGKNGDTVRR